MFDPVPMVDLYDDIAVTFHPGQELNIDLPGTLCL
jgi:hypothetical protein